MSNLKYPIFPSLKMKSLTIQDVAKISALYAKAAVKRFEKEPFCYSDEANSLQYRARCESERANELAKTQLIVDSLVSAFQAVEYAGALAQLIKDKNQDVDLSKTKEMLELLLPVILAGKED